MEARVLTYGGIVQSLKVPDRNGHFDDVVLGFEKLEDYANNGAYIGALIGRCCNRIANGEFKLDDITYHLPINNPPNCLHGGARGFDKVVWAANPIQTAEGPALQLTHLSEDGEQGFPGNLSVTAVYSVTDDNALQVEFTATTDKKTVCNLTHHSYFNLRGSGTILDEVVYINADKFTPVNANLIPTGELRSVEGSPFDFRTPTPIGARINEADDEQIKFARGYDVNWVLNHLNGQFELAASLHDPFSGRLMEVYTTAPGMQFYSGNFLDGTLAGKNGWVYNFRDACCFEPQNFPDAPNHPNFPSPELKPGETYRHKIAYKFLTR